MLFHVHPYFRKLEPGLPLFGDEAMCVNEERDKNLNSVSSIP